MKIIHVVRQFYPSIGGLENFVRSLAATQLAKGYEVEVITLNRQFHQKGGDLPPQDIVDGIRISRLPFFGSYKFPIALSVIFKLRTADIVHVHGVDFFSDYLSLTKFIHNKKLILSTHGGFFHTNYAGPLKKIYFNVVTRFTLRNYSSVCACSNNDLKIFQTVVKRNLHLVENGVDIEKFHKVSSSFGNKTWVYIGRFSDNKCIYKLVDVISKLAALDSTYRLLIIGRDWDGNEGKLSLKIKEMNLGSRVEIHTNLSDLDICSKINSASFIVSASEYEGFGLSLIEGMSAGLIPIASSIPSFKKIISSAEIGLINTFAATKKNVEIIDSYVNSVLKNHIILREEAISAVKQYGWSYKSSEFDRVYEEVLGYRSRNIQGVDIDSRSSLEVIDYLDFMLSTGMTKPVAFANAHVVNQANKLPLLKGALKNFLVLNDGIGVNLASKLKYGKGFSENLNGTDFIPNYLANSKQKLRIFLLGSTACVVAKTKSLWEADFPQHDWVGAHHGFISDLQSNNIIDSIKNSQANVLIVAMGNPIQEMWIHRHLGDTGVSLAFGVGALFDFTSGAVKRAPDWVIKIKCEWVYRLMQEPARLWRRYILGNIIFVFRALRDV